MLAITEDAAVAIDGIVASSGLPGRRGPSDHPGAEHGDRWSAANRPPPVRGRVRAGGRRGARGEPDLPRADAAEFLDDKLLDADMASEEVRFSLDVQAESL